MLAIAVPAAMACAGLLFYVVKKGIELAVFSLVLNFLQMLATFQVQWSRGFDFERLGLGYWRFGTCPLRLALGVLAASLDPAAGLDCAASRCLSLHSR